MDTRSHSTLRFGSGPKSGSCSPIWICRISKAMTAGCFRYRPPLWCAQTGGSRRGSSIRIFASGWKSTIWSPRSATPAERANHGAAPSGASVPVQKLLPVRATKQAHDGGSDRGTLPSGNAIKLHSAARVQSIHGSALQCIRDRRGLWDDRDADIGLKELDQLALRPDFVATVDRDTMFPERPAEPFGM